MLFVAAALQYPSKDLLAMVGGGVAGTGTSAAPAYPTTVTPATSPFDPHHHHHHVMPILPLTLPLFLHSVCVLVDDDDDDADVHSRYCRRRCRPSPPLTPRPLFRSSTLPLLPAWLSW